MVNKKGQAAMEFLMTYGWALLIVLIAIAALAFFGLLSPSTFLPTRADIGPEFQVTGVSAGLRGVTFMVTNGIGSTAYDFQLEVENCKGKSTYGYVQEEETWRTINSGVSPKLNIGAGQSERVTVWCDSQVPNSNFQSDLLVTWETMVGGQRMPHAKEGTLNVGIPARNQVTENSYGYTN
ncbi:MAG: hypothetical protein ACMXYG_01105 [Candidatus Woesearchaeota archaeon]